MTDEHYFPPWNRGKAELLNLVNTMTEELTLFGASVEEGEEAISTRAGELIEESIFIVHGHDEEMKQSVARTLEKLGLKIIILHEQPNKGRTIIEKFMDYSGVASFAIVLLSPDDLVYQSGADPSQARYRARQNVVLELGFFLGKLKRSRVAVIHKEAERFEMPSDYLGVLFIAFDRKGDWKFKLVRELKEAGYQVDANVLI